jgi:hypothetical protein
MVGSLVPCRQLIVALCQHRGGSARLTVHGCM